MASINPINNILKDIKNKKPAPVYFLTGEEPFFIDLILKSIEEDILNDVEKEFDQVVLYGNDLSDTTDIVAQAKQYPMMAPHRVVIIKEAQALSRSIEKLSSYVENPLKTTVLAISYKGKKLDGRTKLAKIIKKNGVFYETPRIYDNQIPGYIDTFAKEFGLTIDVKSKFLMAEFLGADLSRIYNELQKLKIVSKNGKITPEIIEKNIGISKDYNNFELQDAIGNRNGTKAFKISKYFGENPRDNPLMATTAILYSFFSKIIIYHTLKDKSQNTVARELGVHPFFVKDYVTAGRNYPLKKATKAISFLREADLKSKGVGATGNVTHKELLDELIFGLLNT